MMGTKREASQEPRSLKIAESDYAQRTRSLIRLIKDLRALGAEADFDLPRIAVTGNQSAGKSSLVEAISGITVPRASGTCTRCPMECRMTYDEKGPWQCQVLLRRETDSEGNKIAAREEKFGPLIHDKSELEVMLRRAQLAILNPSLPAENLVEFDTASLRPGERPSGSEHQLSFSNNVVCLDLSGPDVIDLSFMDLPGIISNVAAGDDRNNIEAVKQMTTRHIQGNTLILLTITMRDDIDNQGAAHLARLEDEEGLRTIGVLTKPDLIQHGEEDAWLRVMEGTAHPLRHGYFMTKQPSQKELEEKIDFETARQREMTFFDNTSPWNARSHLQNRLGTRFLTKELSKLLGTVINKALPDLRRDSKASYQEVDRLLAALPPPPSEDPAGELFRMVTAFSREVSALVQGEESSEALIQQCRPAYKRFKYDIRGTAPVFVPFTSTENSDGFKITFDVEPNEMTKNQDDENDSSAFLMNLEDVRLHIQRSLTRELPYNVPFKAKVSLIQQFVAEWDDYCVSCFESVHASAAGILKDVLHKHFGQFGGLLGQVEDIMEQQVERSRQATRARIQWMLELDHPPFTNNDHYFSTYRERYLASYKEARKPLTVGLDANAVVTAMSSLAALGFQGLKEEDLAKLRGADCWEEELIVMAETAAYFHVSYKRIIDNIPRIIDHDFLQEISKDVQKALIDGLGLSRSDATTVAAGYLQEDENIASKRHALQEKQKRLRGVMQRLYKFGA